MKIIHLNILETLHQLFGHMSKRRRWQLFLLVVLILLGAVSELMTIGAVLPFLALMANSGRASSFPFLQDLFSSLGWQSPDHILLPTAILFALIAIGAAATRILLVWASQKYIYRLGHDFSKEIYGRTLYQPYSYHVSKNSSELISGIGKIDIVIIGVLTPLLQAFTGVIISIAILSALIVIDATIALIASVGFGIMYLGITYLTRKRLKSNSEIIAKIHTKRIQYIQEGLGGIRDVLIDKTQPIYIDKFKHVDLILRDVQVVNNFIGGAPRFVIEALGMVLIAGLALVMSQSPGGLTEALPVLGALALCAQRMLPMMQQIYHGWASVTGYQQVLFEVLELLDLSMPEHHQISENKNVIPLNQEISLKKLSFRYSEDSPPVLDNIDLLIKRGDQVGFIGKTGSGKSTILDLIMGLLEPTSGVIQIDDTPLTTKNIRGWQMQIAHVPQVIYLSDTTIAENIAFSILPEEIDLERVYAAARRAHVAEFIEGLPKGYKTAVGERGVRLSGGQRQRIGIARALYKQANILIFDEATSALDDKTEADVMTAIRSLEKDLTVLIVAHRLSTIRHCNKVVHLDNGQILAEGPYDEVIPSETIEINSILNEKTTNAI